MDNKKEIKTETGICSWCTKSGIISFTPLETNFKDPRMNVCAEKINVSIISKKLIKMAKGIFACRECVSAYNLRPIEP